MLTSPRQRHALASLSSPTLAGRFVPARRERFFERDVALKAFGHGGRGPVAARMRFARGRHNLRVRHCPWRKMIARSHTCSLRTSRAAAKIDGPPAALASRTSVVTSERTVGFEILRSARLETEGVSTARVTARQVFWRIPMGE